MSRFVRDSFWLTASTGASLLCNLLAQPILNRSLEPAGRGVLALVQLLSGLIYDIVRVGTGAGSSYAAARGESFWPAAIANWLFAGLATVITCAAIFLLPVFWPAGTSSGIPWSVILAALLPAVARGMSAVQEPLTGKSRFRQLSILAVVSAVILLVLRYLLVPRYGVEGALVAEGTSLIVLAAGAVAFALRHYGRPQWPTRALFAEVFRFGLKAASGLTASLLGQRSSTIILYLLCGSVVTGLYAAAAALAMPLLVLPSVLASVLQPRSAVMEDAAAVTQVGLLLRLVILLFIPIVLVGLWLAEPIMHLMGGEEFAGAAATFRILLIAVLPRSIAQILFSHIMGSGHAGPFSIGSTTAAAVTIAACAMLAGPLGARGAAVADLLGSLVLCAMGIYYFSRIRATGPKAMFSPRSDDLRVVANTLKTFAD